jgi:hypothetical protein
MKAIIVYKYKNRNNKPIIDVSFIPKRYIEEVTKIEI